MRKSISAFLAFVGLLLAAAPALAVPPGLVAQAPNSNLYAANGALRVAPQSAGPTYSAGVLNATAAATPTDIAALQLQSYGNIISLRRIQVSCISTAAATVDVLIQKSVNGGGGTSAALNTAKHDLYDTGGAGVLYTYSANRTSNGNGVSATRPVIRAGQMTCGTSATAGVPFVATFGDQGDKPPTIKNLSDWVVTNLNGQTLPAGFTYSLYEEWQEDRVIRIGAEGDSTTALATSGLFNGSGASATGGGMGTAGTLNSLTAIDNQGSNGFRLTDYLMNTNGVTWPLSVVQGKNYDIRLFCYGINDVRTGATTQAQMISMIDAYIYAVLNGTTNGGTYTSTYPGGAGTTFTWTSTIAASPDAKIILWGPNSLLADDPTSSGYVTTTGIFTGMTLAQASQSATDILRNSYAAFANDPRIFALVQKQDVFGTTVKTGANNPLMTDILHPNARGQALEFRQIQPVLVRAINAVITGNAISFNDARLPKPVANYDFGDVGAVAA